MFVCIFILFSFFCFLQKYKVLKTNTINLDIEIFFVDEWVFFVDEGVLFYQLEIKFKFIYYFRTWILKKLCFV